MLLQNFSRNHIDVSVQLDESLDWWRFTGIYGEPDISKRDHTWNLLSHLHNQSNRAWICAGILMRFWISPRNWESSRDRLLHGVMDIVLPPYFGRDWIEGITPKHRQDIEAIHTELERKAAHEETVWRQRSKALWLRGDRIRVFSIRKRAPFRTNSISRICDSGGSWVYAEDEIQQYILAYFNTVYASNRTSPEDIAKGMEHLRTIVDASMREDLLQPFTVPEVTKALFQMALLKLPRPDGMLPIFFQKFWSIENTDVVTCVLNLLNSHVMPLTLNVTNLILIPKCKHPEHLSEFRPISLCNVVYKIASKAIANRIKPIIDKIISLSQSAFIPVV
ncbi:hypothetical protein Sango_0351800 [Sesamum angolense]|uniref:Reverse transcriptase domain-containing protein n=1 Tax=Sesamum angolense TaxID=2727404 RepID=A0AAE1X9G1_9LAMI|nr:hypothetical protein Sango_0351800 [Sesamum angolense]